MKTALWMVGVVLIIGSGVFGQTNPFRWSGQIQVSNTMSCDLTDAVRAMNVVAPFMTSSGGLVTEWDSYAVLRSESEVLRHRAELLDAREKAFSDFRSVLSCLNAKEHGR